MSSMEFLMGALNWGVTNVGLPIGMGYLQREIYGPSNPRTPPPSSPVVVASPQREADYTPYVISGAILVAAIVISRRNK
jgi:hypothetical protein